MKVFVDTGGFAALYLSQDQRHQESKQLWQSLNEQRAQLATSNYVIAETINLLCARSGHLAGLRFGNDFFSTKVIKIIRITETQEQRAWEIFKQYSDRAFSFTDCTSFALMQELGIHSALAFDHHFRVMGFETF